MDKVQTLKLSNEVSMRILKNDFPVNGKVNITILMENNQPAYIEVKKV